jgi:tetratricopeptide (TPR) repeat protein
MRDKKLIALLVISSLIITTLCACSTFRTEIYREETLHRYKTACKLYKQGDYENARIDFEKIIGMDPDYGPAYAALGNLALIGEDYHNALEHYHKAVSVDPELEADLQPLILVAGAHQQRQPLLKAGVGLAQVYPLIMSGRSAELEALLEKDVPLLLLANDTMGITPGRLGEMQRKAADLADPKKGSVRFRLFLGYLLFAGQISDQGAITLINSAVAQAAGQDRQEAFIILGQLLERQEQANKAIDAYLAAVDEGLPMTEVAHHLARVYRVDIASVLPANDEPAEALSEPEQMQIAIQSYIPARPVPELGPLAEPKVIQITERQGSPYLF